MSLRPQSPFHAPIESIASGNLTISPSGSLRRRVDSASDDIPLVSGINRKRRHVSAFEDQFQLDNDIIVPTVAIRKFTMDFLWKLYSGAIGSLGLVWDLCHGLIKEQQQEPIQSRHQQLGHQEPRHEPKRIKLDKSKPIDNDVFNNTTLPGSWLPGSSSVDMENQSNEFHTAILSSGNNSTTNAENTSMQPSFSFGGTSTPYTAASSSPFVGDASSFSLDDHHAHSVNQQMTSTSTPANAAHFLRSIFKGISNEDSEEPAPNPQDNVYHEANSLPDARITQPKRQTKFVQKIIPLKGEGSSPPQKDSGPTFQSTPIRASSFFKERKVSNNFTLNDTNEPNESVPRYGTAFTDQGRRPSSRQVSGSSSTNDLKNERNGLVRSTFNIFNDKNGIQTQKKRRKSLVGERFREAMKTGHIKDIGRHTLQPQNQIAGFPLSYQDETFYHEFFARAQKRHSGENDIRTSFIYSSRNSKDSFIELPSQSPSSAKKERYEALHAGRLKLEKQIKDLKLGRSGLPVEPLSSSAINQVNQYLSKSRQQDDLLIASDFKVDIRLRDLKTLRPGTWLNDNIIDFFLAAVNDNARLINASKSFAFSTHFFSTLSGPRGYDGVSRWAKRKGIDVTKMDYLFVPINQNNTHWCLGMIDNKHRRFVFYNSLSGDGRHALDILEQYMVKESTRLYPDQTDKFEKLYESYEKQSRASCPQQTNGSDCGVFTCINVELISHGKDLNYSQDDMPMMRKRMAHSIISHGQKSKM